MSKIVNIRYRPNRFSRGNFVLPIGPPGGWGRSGYRLRSEFDPATGSLTRSDRLLDDLHAGEAGQSQSPGLVGGVFSRNDARRRCRSKGHQQNTEDDEGKCDEVIQLERFA